jgi:hypothetical protein
MRASPGGSLESLAGDVHEIVADREELRIAGGGEAPTRGQRVWLVAEQIEHVTNGGDVGEQRRRDNDGVAEGASMARSSR